MRVGPFMWQVSLPDRDAALPSLQAGRESERLGERSSAVLLTSRSIESDAKFCFSQKLRIRFRARPRQVLYIIQNRWVRVSSASIEFTNFSTAFGVGKRGGSARPGAAHDIAK